MKITHTILITIIITSTLTNVWCGQEFAQLNTAYENFTTKICPSPLSTNTITAVASNNTDKQQKIVKFAKDSYLIMDDKTKI